MTDRSCAAIASPRRCSRPLHHEPFGDAWARIRTWEPLREGILRPSPLTRLGYPRAAAQRPRSVKPFPSHGDSVTPPEAFSCRPASGPRRRPPWCSTSRRDSSTKLRAASTRTRSGGRRPPGSPRRSSSRAPIGTRRSSSTFRPAGSRSTKSRLTSPRISSSKEPTRRSEEHTSELQSPVHLVCRLLLEKKKKKEQHVK